MSKPINRRKVAELVSAAEHLKRMVQRVRIEVLLPNWADNLLTQACDDVSDRIDDVRKEACK